MIKWETPKEDKRGRKPGKWAAIAESLKDRPGEWALVAEDDWVQSARKLLVGCEVTCRGVNKTAMGKAEKIYARYIGE